jgi:hypothetical protein
MSQVEIIVLANSVKHNQHCVAGKLLDNSQWVRPVSNPQGGELSDEQARIQNPHGIFYVKREFNSEVQHSPKQPDRVR